MRDTILLSIYTKYAEKILDGTKKYEFRGWKIPENVKYVYIYSSRIEKKIVGRFEIKNIHRDTPEKIWKLFNKYSGVTKKDFFDYAFSFDYATIYAIEIENIVVFQRFVSLDEIKKGFNAPQRFRYLLPDEVIAIERFLNI